MITHTAGLLLAIRVADCTPVIVVDRKRKAVGIFHAGWRGTAQRIVEKGIGEMRRQLGCDPEDMLAVIGPAIGACCYEIGEEVENEFDSQFAYSKELFEDVFDSWSLKTKYPWPSLNQRAPGHGEPAMSRHLDLVKANWCQLLDAGVPGRKYSVDEPMHGLPDGSVFLLPQRAGDGTNAGGGGDPVSRSMSTGILPKIPPGLLLGMSKVREGHPLPVEFSIRFPPNASSPQDCHCACGWHAHRL